MNRIKKDNSMRRVVKIIKQTARKTMKSGLTEIAEEKYKILNREQTDYIKLMSILFGENEDIIQANINVIDKYVQDKKHGNINLLDDEEIKLIVFALIHETIIKNEEIVQLFLEQIERKG